MQRAARPSVELSAKLRGAQQTVSGREAEIQRPGCSVRNQKTPHPSIFLVEEGWVLEGKWWSRILPTRNPKVESCHPSIA